MNKLVRLAPAVDAFDAVAHDPLHGGTGVLVLDKVGYESAYRHAMRKSQSLDALQPIFNRCRHFPPLRDRLDNVTIAEAAGESILGGGGLAA